MNAICCRPDSVSPVSLNKTQSDRGRVIDQLMPLVYNDLQGLAHSLLQWERPGHLLQATALVHEAYLRMIDQNHVSWRGGAHFRAIAATMIRRVLLDHARSQNTRKRGGCVNVLPLGENVDSVYSDNSELPETDALNRLAVHEAIDRLEDSNPRQARVVELRFFECKSISETAQALNVSPRTVLDDWRVAKAWLRKQLDGELAN